VFIDGIIEDITERKELEQKLIAEKEKAEEMNRVKSSFFSNMSHELRTPMIGILGYAELLQEPLDDVDVKRYAAIIFNGGRRLMETLNLILDMSRVEAGKIKSTIFSFEVILIIKEVIGLFHENAIRKSLYLRANFDSDSFYIESDPALFRQIINNLVNNALKYTKEGGVEINLRTETQNGQTTIIIKVSDTGIGIAEEHLDLVWEEFRQVSEGKGRSFEGTGLGLSITQNFVAKLGGQISVESKLGVGSTFTVMLPITPHPANEVTKVEESVHLPLPPVVQKTRSALPVVLYVEDDPVAVL